MISINPNKKQNKVVEKPVSNDRLDTLDAIRGITLISMIIYHGIWDMVYIAGIEQPWYNSWAAYLWQQSICWTFILISGFCRSFSRHKVRRATEVFGAGLLVTFVTLLAAPQNLVLFGILTMIGSSMFLMIPLEKPLLRVDSRVGAIASFMVFILLKNVNDGYIGIGESRWLGVPQALYEGGEFSALFGFPGDDFFSTDYFPLLPWFFLFLTGYFIYGICNQKKLFDAKLFKCVNIPVVNFMGRHSLIIYLLHQPVLYGMVLCFMME